MLLTQIISVTPSILLVRVHIIHQQLAPNHPDYFLVLLDKDLAHLPAEKKERFTRMPKAIAIDFVREFKEDKLGQSSPCVVKKAIEKTVSPTKDVHKPPQESPRRFNTKVKS